MSINLYDTTITPFKNMLQNLLIWLKKAEAHAAAKSLPQTYFTEGRLAPDMLPLPEQIYIACNAAKFVAVRVAEHPNQVFTDDQKTLAELQGRIADTLAYLDGVKREEFDHPDVLTKEITAASRTFSGALEYVNWYAVPTFYFHVVTAYDILRHKGLDIGKMDYLIAAKNAAAAAAP